MFKGLFMDHGSIGVIASSETQHCTQFPTNWLNIFQVMKSGTIKIYVFF